MLLLAHKFLLHSLTDTQTMILYLATQRLPISEVAETLQLTEKEVRKQFFQALRKLKSPALRRLFSQVGDKVLTSRRPPSD